MIPDGAFSLDVTAEPAHIDELGHVNNVVWVGWIQDIATAHWRAEATPEDQAAYVWFVLRHEIDYHRAMQVGERATAYTWAAENARGARFNRHMCFVGADGRLLVSSITTWAMIDRSTGKPVRVPERIIAQFQPKPDRRPAST